VLARSRKYLVGDKSCASGLRHGAYVTSVNGVARNRGGGIVLWWDTSIAEKDRGRWRRAKGDQVGMDTSVSAGWQLRRREKRAVENRSDLYAYIYIYTYIYRYMCMYTYNACKYICTNIIYTHIEFALRVFRHVYPISPNIRVYAGMYKYARIRMKTYGSHTRA
jgi:hypothetical protein